jgi:dTDP-4-amino-4,6-dideoxygalactose transaminase
MILTETGTAPTPDNFKIAEAGLLAQTGGKLAVWSGRAATAFYHAFKLAMRRRPDIKEPEIIMPAMSCTTAANVAAMMGIKPRFADIVPARGFSPTLDRIQRRFRPRLNKTIAVVAIHLFGNEMELDTIRQWCKENNLLLIEDPTQALGGKYRNGDYLGSKGDVAIYSFNKTKIIEAGNGVLIANTDETVSELEQLLAEEKTPFPTIRENQRSELGFNYRNMHHSLVSVLRANPANMPVVSETFLQKRAEFEALYLRPANPQIDLNTAWKDLETSLIHRKRLAEIYASVLQGSDVLITAGLCLLKGFRQSGVCWRFSFMIENNPEQQVAFSEAVRKDGFHVSNLYWPVNQFFNPGDECPNADWLARRIINLWVDTSVDEDYVERCAASVIRHAEELL